MRKHNAEVYYEQVKLLIRRWWLWLSDQKVFHPRLLCSVCSCVFLSSPVIQALRLHYKNT